MPATKRKTEIETRTVGKLFDPIITVSDIPASVEVGDEVIPKVTVEKEAGTPLVGGRINSDISFIVPMLRANITPILKKGLT
jgi:hypothetical protein